MALDLGELVGYLVVDDKRWNFDGPLKSMDQFDSKTKAVLDALPKTARGSISETSREFHALAPEMKVAVTQANAEAAERLLGRSVQGVVEANARRTGDAAGDALSDTLVPAAERAGEEAGEKAGDGLKTKGALGAAAAGALVGAAFVEALDVDAAADKLVAQLGANAVQAERYGRVAGNLYANAWGDSMDHVNEAIGAVVSSIDGMDTASGRQLGRLTSRALDFATAFEVDVTRSVQVADTLIEAKLAKNGLRAFDLLTKGAQKVPSALREDLMDAVEEYGQFFASLGYSGPQAFALLVDASEKGIYGLDKAGDAVKEFTIRATDGSKASKDAYALIGLSAEDMGNKILKGGDDAQEATQKVIDGLLGIEDPSQRAQAAIALFGTPLEDLNVRDIPDFLRSLQGTSDAMDGVRGSSKRMSDDLNSNSRTSITEFTRTMKTELVGYLEDKVIPVLEDDVIPAVRRFGDWFEKDGGPALRDFKDDLDPVIGAVGDLAGFLNDMPGEAKLAALGGALAGGLVVKHKLAGIFDRGGPANPMFVVVTNPTGVPGVPGGAPDGKPGSKVASLARGAAKALPPVLVIGGLVYAVDELIFEPAKKDATRLEPTREGWDSTLAAVEAAEHKAKGFGETLDLVGSKKVAPLFAVPGLAKGREGLAEFIRLQIEAGKPVTSYIHLTGVERAMAQIATLNAGINALGERGLDNGVPYVHGGTPDRVPGRQPAGRSPFDGATFNVQPPNYDAFMNDMQRRQRRANLGGRPAPGGRR
jgi:hypothetical protein